MGIEYTIAIHSRMMKKLLDTCFMSQKLKNYEKNRYALMAPNLVKPYTYGLLAPKTKAIIA